MLELSPFLEKNLTQGPDLFDRLMEWPGEVFRQIANRRTVRFEIAGRSFFLKTHRGIGWGEILKSLLQGNLPVTSARNEYEAIKAVEETGVATQQIAGFGIRGLNPAARESFLITEELQNKLKLAHIEESWAQLPEKQITLIRSILIEEVALLASKIHRHGLNHRDLYLDHLMVESRDWVRLRAGESIKLYLIDLHRAQMRRKVPNRWLVKDLGGLLFSALHLELSTVELALFIRKYSHRPAGRELKDNSLIWKKVMKRAIRMYKKHYGKNPVLPPEFT